MEDESNIRLAYATHEDIAACCPAETVLAVRVREPCANFSIIIFFQNVIYCGVFVSFSIGKLGFSFFDPVSYSRPLPALSLKYPGLRWKSEGEENTKFISRFVLSSSEMQIGPCQGH